MTTTKPTLQYGFDSCPTHLASTELLKQLKRAQRSSDSAKATAANASRFKDYARRDRSEYARANYLRSRDARKGRYGKKERALHFACFLAHHLEGLNWGFGEDGDGARVLYFDLPTGQVSFHVRPPDDVPVPAYNGLWDRQGEMVASRLAQLKAAQLKHLKLRADWEVRYSEYRSQKINVQLTRLRMLSEQFQGRWLVKLKSRDWKDHATEEPRKGQWQAALCENAIIEIGGAARSVVGLRIFPSKELAQAHIDLVVTQDPAAIAFVYPASEDVLLNKIMCLDGEYRTAAELLKRTLTDPDTFAPKLSDE